MIQTVQQVQNIRHAITVMERVKFHEEVSGKRYLDMCSWQSDFNRSLEDIISNKSPKYIRDEASAHRCGIQACFGGWIAMAKEFQCQGIYSDPLNGEPRFSESRYQNIGSVFKILFGWNKDLSLQITLDSKAIFTPGKTHSGDVTTTHIIGWLKERLVEAEASQPKPIVKTVEMEAEEAIVKAKGSPINHQLANVGVVRL